MMTSEIEILNKFISNIQKNSSTDSQPFELIPYEQFNEIKSLPSEGLSNIRIAKWINGPITDKNEQKRKGPLNVVLKTLINWGKNNSESSASVLNQVHYHYNFYNISPDKFLPIYGITKDPSKNELVSITKYAEEGDLYDYLNSNFSSINWNQKISILSSFLHDLKIIHEQGFMHKDIHSKNILLSKKDDLLIAYLPTSGLTKPIAPNNENKRIYGILPYIAPEVLRGKEYIQASDIYSVGIVMCELSTGEIPFKGKERDVNLSIDICNGERPKLSDNAPNMYNEVVQMCWASDPSIRPNISKLESIVSEWRNGSTEFFSEK